MEQTAEQLTQSFIEALGTLERFGDIDDLVGMYRDDATVGNVLEERPLNGRIGARSFWVMYRNTFRQVHSTFRNVIVGEGRAALEWSCTGTFREGQPVTYAGVTILEFQDGAIARSWAYFDAAGLGAQLREREIVPFDPGA